MVITCPSCFARYRLSPDKLQGKGAKITCPKCSHVFVVFTDAQGAATSGGEAAAPGTGGEAGTASDASTQNGGRDAATTTGAFKAVGLDPAGATAGASQPVKVVAPGPRGKRKAVDTGQMDAIKREDVDGSHGATVGGGTGAHGASGAASGEDEPRNASNLDFRSVGIQTWKVKVAIGLIYDFSDIATLKKYLADKKVTPKDQLSHNGKDWVKIEDAGDLDQHFIKIWKESKKAADSGILPPPKAKKVPQEQLSSGAIPAIATGSGAHGQLDPAASGGIRTVGTPVRGSSEPAGRAAKAPVRANKKSEGQQPKNNTALLALAAVLLLGAGAWFVFQAGNPPAQQANTAVPAARTPSSATPSVDSAKRKEIEEGIAKRLDDGKNTSTPEAPEETPDDIREREDLVAVRQTESARTPGGPQMVRTPTPAPPTRTNPTPAPAPTPAPQVVQTTSKDPGQMYLDAGRKKLASGDYGSAKKMLELATDKSATCGACWAALSEAYTKLGEADKAAAAAGKARDLGTQLNANHP